MIRAKIVNAGSGCTIGTPGPPIPQRSIMTDVTIQFIFWNFLDIKNKISGFLLDINKPVNTESFDELFNSIFLECPQFTSYNHKSEERDFKSETFPMVHYLIVVWRIKIIIIPCKIISRINSLTNTLLVTVKSNLLPVITCCK